MRSSQHRIETRSRRAFVQLLPDAWVARSITPDYGLDFEVELFDNEGDEEGLTFWVQLKATRQSRKRACSVRVRPQHCLYYSSLESPVLLVSYHEPSKTFYAAWFHDVAPADLTRSQFAVVRLQEQHRWESQTPTAIAAFLRARRELRQGATPVRVRLEVVSGHAHGYSKGQLASRLRTLVEFAGINVGTHDESESLTDHAVLVVSSQSAHAKFATGGLAGTVFSEELAEKHQQRRLPTDLSMLLAFAAYDAGRSDVAVPIIIRSSPKSTLLALRPIRALTVKCLVEARQAATVFQLASQFAEHGDGDAAQEFELGLLALRNTCDSSLRPALLSHFQRVLAQETGSKNRTRAANACCWIGDQAFRDNDWRKCVRMQIRAMRLAPQLRQLHGTWTNLGVGLFNLRRFAWSAEVYKRSLTIVPRTSIRFWRGDALLYAGSFADAAGEFTRVVEEYLGDTSIDEHQRAVNAAEAVVLAGFSQLAVATVGAAQRRNSRLANELTGSALGIEPSPDSHVRVALEPTQSLVRAVKTNLGRELRAGETGSPVDLDRVKSQTPVEPSALANDMAILDEAIAADVLADDAWLLKAMRLEHQGRATESALAYIAAAVCRRRDAAVWVQALCVTAGTTSLQLLWQPVYIAARKNCGDIITSLLIEMAAPEDQSAALELLERVELRLADVDRWRPGVALRYDGATVCFPGSWQASKELVDFLWLTCNRGTPRPPSVEGNS